MGTCWELRNKGGKGLLGGTPVGCWVGDRRPSFSGYHKLTPELREDDVFVTQMNESGSFFKKPLQDIPQLFSITHFSL